MDNSVDPQPGDPPNVWRPVPTAEPPVLGSQQWRSPAMSVVPAAQSAGSPTQPPMLLPAASPATTVRSMTVPPTVQSGGRRLIDRRLFWYVLLLLALVLLLLSFWVWNRPTDAELGLLSTHLGGTP